ncbi:MAG TPA: hypothetical protein VFD51_02155 [Patescibacteria group bacterium]|nr:hypothetical protein [Patescibacteria group bacterium]
MSKATREDVSKSIDKVVEDARSLINSNGFTDEKRAEKEVKDFLISKQLKKVDCKCRAGSEISSFYIQFSFDDCIIENATIRKRLKKH